MRLGTSIALTAIAVCFCFPSKSFAGDRLSGTQPAFGSPIRDEVFLQEVGKQILSKTPVLAVGVHGSKVFAGTSEGLFEVAYPTLNAVGGVTGSVHRLVQVKDTLCALTPQAVYLKEGNGWKRIEVDHPIDVAVFHERLFLATPKQLMLFQGGAFVPATTNPPPFTIERLAAFNDSLYIQGGKRISFFDGLQFGGTDLYGSFSDLGWDWGALPSSSIRDVLALGPRMYLATDRGLGVLRGMTVLSIRGVDGLPFEDLTCLAAGFANDVWVGTTRGAIRKVSDNEFHYFSGRRWLPAEHVNALAVQGQSVWMATDGGLASVDYVPMTLSAKADFYERALVRNGQKRLGLIHKLEWDDALGEYVREAGDNDGGYSSDYLSAQSYRYAVTKDPKAREEAVNTFKALRWLERMTGISGFPARSVWVKGERGHKSSQGSGGYPAEWHDVPGTAFEWKGDTSSDELCAHFYAVGLFLELAAQGEEITQAKAHLERIASHLVMNGWQLLDLDNKPTRWGRWDPDYFRTAEGRFDEGLQCLEILSFMKTAADVTGSERFQKAYAQLVQMEYPRSTLRQRAVFPTDSVANFEDQLSFWVYWNLLRRESDPVLRSVYRRSFERTWEVLRVEQQPWFNFVYGALTGNECEADRAVAHLREWPLDLVQYSFQNSHRADLRPPPGYKVVKAAERAFSPREREPMRWDAWTMTADGGSDGRDMVEPSGWLVAYWMGRFHGFITGPERDVSVDVQIPMQRGSLPGARPYDGPLRPELP